MTSIGKQPKVKGEPKSSRLVMVTDWDPSPARHDYWENLAKDKKVCWLSKQGEVGQNKEGPTKGRHIQVAFQGHFTKTISAWRKFLGCGEEGIKIHDNCVRFMHSNGGLKYQEKDASAEEDPTIRRRFEWGERPKSVKMGNIMSEKLHKEKEIEEKEEYETNKIRLKEMEIEEAKQEKKKHDKWMKEIAEEAYTELRTHKEQGKCTKCTDENKTAQYNCEIRKTSVFHNYGHYFPWEDNEGIEDYMYHAFAKSETIPGTLPYLRWLYRHKNDQQKLHIVEREIADRADEKQESN